MLLSSRFRKLSLLLVLGLTIFYLQIVLTERQQYIRAAIKRQPPPPKNQNIDDNEYEPGKLLVRSLLKHAWQNYKTYAWGEDELLPVSKKGSNFFGPKPLALSMVDALDTLLICELHEEYKEAAAYVLTTLTFDHDMAMSLFESNIRIVGGLLAVFGLTGDGRFASKAFDLAQRYLTCFATDDNNNSVLPNREVMLMAHVRPRPAHATGPRSCITAEAGTLLMEWAYMSHIIKDKTLRNKAYRIVERFGELKGEYDGLLPKVVNVDYEGPQPGRTFSMKAYLTKEIDGKTYLIEREQGQEVMRQEHLACFAGGLFALAGKELDMPEYIELGAAVTESCYRMYAEQPTGLGPEAANVPDLTPQEAHWIMRPEVVESIFILYRVTADPKYRQWGYTIAQNIERHARLDTGLSGIRDVTSKVPEWNDKQESFFLAETLKYLYLLFCDRTYVSLEEYVFNTEAHPLPIIKSGL